MRQFKCLVVGQYYALFGAGSTTLKRYEAEFVLPSQEAALSIICKHLLTPYLTKKFSDFVHFYTHELKSITVVGNQPNAAILQMGIDEMTIGQLADFCILRGITIDPYKHSDLELCREKVAEAWAAKRQERLDSEKSGKDAEKAEVDHLLEMNQLPSPTEGIQMNLNEQKVYAAKRKLNESGNASAIIPDEESNVKSTLDAII